MNQVPLWLQVLQALLTPTVAVAVGFIAFMQWRTAHQKVVLDLFDRRLAIYDGVIAAVEDYLSHFDDRSKASLQLYRLGLKAEFLFGAEVAGAIDRLRDDIYDHMKLVGRVNGSAPQLDVKAKADLEVLSERLIGVHERFATVCAPYMRMDQKVSPSVGSWLQERNRIRLSYADEHQR